MVESAQRLEHLGQLWNLEQRATQARFHAERTRLSLVQRIHRGLALRNLSIDELGAAPGARTTLHLSADPAELDMLAAHAGTPVLLWWEDPEDDDTLRAVVSRKSKNRISVMISGDLPERFDEPGFRLDIDAPQATFQRGHRALKRTRDAEPRSDLARLRGVLFGQETPEFSLATLRGMPLDRALNTPQLDAVAHALSARDVALIHGPPGTGKTRTLVEVIRQAVLRGESVLATAASNAAVDNLAERLHLSDDRLNIVRLGHPARIASAVTPCCLDVLLEATTGFALSRRWMAEANALRNKARKRETRGQSRGERSALMSEAWRLTKDARLCLRGEQDRIIERAQVIFATAAGADGGLLGRRRFDVVVIDEATQASDPMALVPITRGARVVLAGDPHQLPPTVIDARAGREGLATTLFERLAGGRPEAVRMLTVQHRMHEDIMFFPSESKYEGKLEAAPDVATHTLEDLQGVSSDPLRPGPLIFMDTAGKGWEEVRNDAENDPSTSNPGHAERIVLEITRVLNRGLSPEDVAIITPYRAQVRAIKELLSVEWLDAGLEVDTVDGFQGREKEAILVDLVRSNPDGELGFLRDTRRMNVALTRARRYLLVLGDSATLGHHSYYKAFLDGIEMCGVWESVWNDDGS